MQDVIELLKVISLNARMEKKYLYMDDLMKLSDSRVTACCCDIIEDRFNSRRSFRDDVQGWRSN